MPPKTPTTRNDLNHVERRPLHLLYIEDDLAVGLLLKTVVERHGDTVEIAMTGAEGLEQAETGQFDIIILDYHLPDMTGIDIGRKILMKMPDVPLIMITGQGNERLASEALNLGFSEYLVKDSADVFLELVPSIIEHCWRRQAHVRQLRSTQELLSEVNDRFTGLVQLSPDGLMVITGRTIVFANPAMDGVFGEKKPDELIGASLSAVVETSVAKEIGTFIDTIIAGKLKRKTFQIENTVLDDGTRHLEIAAGYCEFAGEPAVQMVVHDVTESKRIEEELHLAKDAADSSNRAKTSFLSSMSHELRTPLNAVMGFSQLLLMDTGNPLNDKQRDNVGHILRSGQHLLALIDDLLDLARIEAGRLNVDMVAYDTAPLIDEAVTMVTPLTEAQGITIDATGALQMAGMPQARIDVHRFRQVMVNLLSNAIKYNKANGTVFITTEHIAPDKIRVSVRDTGMGIPDDLADGLFEPFNRLGADATSIQGTGIGLSITKKLVELMGGEIGYNSLAGEGTTFRVDVAVAEDQPA